MAQHSSSNKNKIILLLKFLLTIDDKEIIDSTIESIIEMLQEEKD